MNESVDSYAKMMDTLRMQNQGLYVKEMDKIRGVDSDLYMREMDILRTQDRDMYYEETDKLRAHNESLFNDVSLIIKGLQNRTRIVKDRENIADFAAFDAAIDDATPF